MKSNNLQKAEIGVLSQIFIMQKIPLHQGTCDVTDIIDFHDVASQFNLTNNEYEALIDFGQEELNNRIEALLWINGLKIE